MTKTKKDFWNGPLTGSRIKSDDVKLPEMLIGYFIGPFGALDRKSTRLNSSH